MPDLTFHETDRSFFQEQYNQGLRAFWVTVTRNPHEAGQAVWTERSSNRELQPLSTFGAELAEDHSGHTVLVVWELPHIAVDRSDQFTHVAISCTLGAGQNITVNLISSLPVVSLSQASVLASSVLRIRSNQGWVYPVAPVKTEAWPFVRHIHRSPGSSSDSLSWDIELAGGVELAGLAPESTALADLALGDTKQDPFTVAVWPPEIAPAWAYYVVRLGPDDDPGGTDRFAAQYDVRIYCGRPSELARQPQATERHGNVWTVELEPGSDAIGPRYVAITQKSDGATGIFELNTLRSHVQDAGALNASLDRGSTNTCAAREVQGGAEPLELVGDPSDGPNVIAGWADRDVHAWPWVPEWLRTSTANSAEQRAQLPTAIYRRSRRIAADRPFASYGLLAPDANLYAPLRDQATADRLENDLKWGDRDNETRAYLVGVLTWIAWRLRRQASSLHILATYPLAFTPQQKTDYKTLLIDACTISSRLSGRPITLFQNRLVVDESSALIQGMHEEFAAAQRGRSTKLVFAADLGGGSLETNLSLIGPNNTYRLLAADSLRFGADRLVGYIAKRQTRVEGALSIPTREAVVQSVVRSGRLPDIIRRAAEGQPDGWLEYTNKLIGWAGSSSGNADEAVMRCHVYNYLLLEYCARFVAGTLRDQRQLRRRLAGAPGNLPNAADAFDPSDIALFIRFSGNGWGFISPSCSGLSSSVSPGTWLEARIKTLLTTQLPADGKLAAGDGEDDEILDAGAHTSINWVRIEQAQNAKTLTALGAHLAAPSMPAEDRTQGQLPILATPNGVREVDNDAVYPWFVAHVPPGGRPTLPGFAGTIRDDVPAFPAFHPPFQSSYGVSWGQMFNPADHHESIRRRQGATHGTPREVSTLQGLIAEMSQVLFDR